MSEHVRDDDIRDFAMGAMAEDAIGPFERHLASCPACSAKLAEEARFELAMIELGATAASGDSASPEAAPAPGPAPRGAAAPVAAPTVSMARWRARAAIAAGVLAIAAGAYLMLRPAAPPPTSASAPPTPTPSAAPIAVVICVSGPKQADCVEEAHRRGLYVGHPHWGGPPPFGGAASAAGPSNPPFQLSERTKR